MSVGVTIYVTLPLPVSVCAMVEPEPAACPLTVPVTVPIVQAKLAPAGVLLRAMFVIAPLQIAAGVTGLTVRGTTRMRREVEGMPLVNTVTSA